MLCADTSLPAAESKLRGGQVAPTISYRFHNIPCTCLFFNYTLQSFKAYCAIWVRRYNFRYQTSPRVSPLESTQRLKMKLWARNVREFCLNADLHVTFRDLLHAVKLRHGTDGFTSLRRKACWGFFRPKNPTALAGGKPANLGTKSQHATSRPMKPLWPAMVYTVNIAPSVSALIFR